MQERHYKSILYFISSVILITLVIQGYWNYKNYQSTKQQLITEVQTSLDNAVENYYANLAEENLIGLSISNDSGPLHPLEMDSILFALDSLDSEEATSAKQTSITIENTKENKSISIFTNSEVPNVDTLFNKISLSKKSLKGLTRWHRNSDSSKAHPFNELSTRLIFAMSADTLKVSKMDSLVQEELLRKNINVDYGITYTNKLGEVQISRKDLLDNDHLTTETRSNYLPKNSKMQLHFSNIMRPVLQRSLWGFLFSFLFVSAVIGCLLYLLHIIRQQKQLAEVKNDLISNITHEFKTPIATIGAAVEGIQHFNETNDPEKNQRYAAISSQQVDKLNAMVEKLLETATLDNDAIPLEFETANLVPLLQNACANESLFPSEKTIRFTKSHPEIMGKIDVFHFENAINNIMDNAIKYGGDVIKVHMEQASDHIEMTFQDNGTALTSALAKQVFEKFYRVPKGNTHDVKGFGIGLFYTKKIIERHHGHIQVTTHPSTTFRILLPRDV